jgi:hypothetical protein
LGLHDGGEVAKPKRLVNADDGACPVRGGVDGGDCPPREWPTTAGSLSASCSTTARISPTSESIEYSGAAEDAP